MTTIADGLKDVFLAGVGAMALGAEKTQELVESLIAKGEITVEQGKAGEGTGRKRCVHGPLPGRDGRRCRQEGGRRGQERFR